jgi:trans-aconitate methyltransferase
MKAKPQTIAESHLMESRFPFLLPAWHRLGLRLSGRVLDLGCSEGALLNALEIRASCYVGVELKRALLAEAKKRFPKHQFIRADIRHLPFRSEVFNLIFAVSMFEHIPTNDLYHTVKQVTELLLQEGQVAVQIPNSRFPIELHSHIPFFFYLPRAIREKLKPNPGFYDLRPHTLIDMDCWNLRCGWTYTYPSKVTGLPRFIKSPIPMGFQFIFAKKG